MNVKKLILTSAISLGALTGFAQAAGEVIEYDFIPNAYLQLQVGGQETVGEGSFGDLLSPNAQLSFGYQWNPLFGARIGVNAWQSKGGLESAGDHKYWKWNYVAPMVDLTFDLTNAFGGYNPERVWDLNLFAGIGANVHFSNDEANDLAKNYAYFLGNLWDGTKVNLAGRVGLACDWRVAENLKLGLEASVNATDDRYNSKVGSNADWYVNALVGLKYTFGQSYNKRVVPVVAPVQEIIRETVYRDTVIVQQPVQTIVEAPAHAETFERNVFFKINQSIIRPQEMTKVEEIANYMNAHPKAMVHITGYADKGTGTLSINLRLARERANAVVNALINKYGISESRITSSSMTDELFQPFEEPVKNRVAICVVE